jgi:benzoyl-CoA 2,3-dioxygenase component B
MLTEEAHHMFVGETGVGRAIERTAQVMNELGTDDPAAIRAHGAIDLPTIQRYLNRWFSSSINLFGGEQSSNAASYFAAGLKGRYKEEKYEDHVAIEGAYPMVVPADGALRTEDVPLRNAMNEVLRDGYVQDCEFVVGRWNRVLEKEGRPETMTLPSRRFNRDIGIYSGATFDPEGNPIAPETFDRRRSEWLPTEDDKTFVSSLMKPCLGLGRIAGWIAPPKKGINGNPFEWEYVRFDRSSAGVALGATPTLLG